MDKPLLISGPLIDPTRTGLKTETRRSYGLEYVNEWGPDNYVFIRMEYIEKTKRWFALFRRTNSSQYLRFLCPYGGKGDTLWVRENWFTSYHMDSIPPRDLPKDEAIRIGFMADLQDDKKPKWAGKTRPAIHLPRWLSRFDLLNLETYPERLHDITEEGAAAEACPISAMTVSMHWGQHRRVAFQKYWQLLNGTWEANPWVWVIKFKLKPQQNEN